MSGVGILAGAGDTQGPGWLRNSIHRLVEPLGSIAAGV
ncbi:hypothetical protein RISK_006601 [Rhodopirellula islandica]|uniref:Uncharacterized protein n=1 Tax=Rhodopirellula islandica TaxID=595434 RepID=A0A0J1B3M8_RHOIS|nr:hypothetical protein RISK_006601 [Rhodopirellula islandica]